MSPNPSSRPSQKSLPPQGKPISGLPSHDLARQGSLPPSACSVMLRHRDSKVGLISRSVPGSWQSERLEERSEEPSGTAVGGSGGPQRRWHGLWLGLRGRGEIQMPQICSSRGEERGWGPILKHEEKALRRPSPKDLTPRLRKGWCSRAKNLIPRAAFPRDSSAAGQTDASYAGDRWRGRLTHPVGT